MAIGLGDLLQITDFQQHLAQQNLNVYYYRCTSITGLDDTAYNAILDWFVTNILTPVKNIQVGNLYHDRLLIQNLSNGVDFVDRPLTTVVNGTRPGESMPGFVAWGFRMLRETLATRNGAKRIGGVSETDTYAGVPIPGMTTPLTNVANALKADVVIGLVTIAEPVIVKRPITVPMGTGYVYSSVGGADFRGVTSQNTRKPGRGV